MKVLAAFALMPTGQDGPDRVVGDLGPIEEALTGARARRVGRHARMSLVGAAGCAKAAGCAVGGDRTAVILGSGLGNMAETIPVVEQAVPAGLGLTPGSPSPVQFANSVSNSATFQAAKATGATGWNFVVAQEERSFEAALQVAGLILSSGAADLVLAGGTDERVPPRERTLDVLGLPPATVLGEGSAWLLVARDEGADAGAPARADILAARQLADADEVPGIVGNLRRDGEPLFLLPGWGVEPPLATGLAAKMGAEVRPYLDRTGVFPTAAALALAEVAGGTDAAPGLYVHVTTGAWGAAMVVMRIGVPFNPAES